jgi:hypothetical protein
VRTSITNRVSCPGSRSLPLPAVRRRSKFRNGFAIIVTVSILVLLAVVAVGLLTLSTVTVRASKQGDAAAIARANARLALMLAIGDLQKSAGPDQRITARANIIGENVANSQITGVWSSWEIKATDPPSPSAFEKSARDAKFRSWLVSNPNPTKATSIDFVRAEPTEPVTLWGKGTLGSNADPSSQVRASKVPVATSKGAFAYAVLDEGVKARINTGYQDNVVSAGAKAASLGSGERAGVEFMPGLDGLHRDFFKLGAPEFDQINKGITPLNYAMAAEALAPGARDALQLLTHDVSTQSVGLFTNVARGGLKEDFQLMTNSGSLPASFAGTGPYVTNLGLSASAAPSDPRWESLFEFSNLYRDGLTNSGNLPLLKSKTPSGWNAIIAGRRGDIVNTAPPPGLTLLPTIAKVQVLFSLIGRDLYDYPAPVGNTIPPAAPVFHNPQGSHFRGTQYQYDLHVMYTPIVTLHNPYNVALEFENLRVEFVHTPFALQIFRNGIAQSKGLVPVETMYADNESGSQNKTFGINLKNSKRGIPDSPTFRLLPGEVKVFSPYVDPNRSYRDEFRNGRETWDIYVSTGITNQIVAIPGWRGDGIGYSCDWVTGAQRVNGNADEGHWAACLGLAKNDRIHVLFAPLSVPQYSDNKFLVRMTASTGGRTTVVNAIEIDYENPDGLQQTLLGRNGTLRYPKSGSIQGIDLVDHSTTKLKDIAKVKPFALLSVQAKTTHGAADSSKEDGRLATKPWAFAHAVMGSSTQKVLSQHSANFSHEIDLQLLENGTANLVQVDAKDRGNFISGHSAFNGTKFGVHYDIPLAPIQTLASLNGANPGGSSGLLPRFANPIGNSWAHPLLSPSTLLEPGIGGNYLDHSFLLNLALYDRYYFSGLANQTGPFGTGRTTASLAADFAAGTPLDDPRLIYHQPGGRKDAALTDEVTKTTAYTSIAAWQLMEGAFNVNSTSVPAWKAMLASIHDLQALLNQIDKPGNTSRLVTLPPVDSREVRVSRLRLPASTSAADGADPRDGFWLGPRELQDEQIRLRGPFLSMADFVNRRLGDENDPKAQRGALQQAIDDSNLNQAVAAGATAGFEIPLAAVLDYNYRNPTAGSGPSYQGAPGFITQADILNVLGNAATPRSDTFTIRCYGEAQDATGKVLARASCEAVVQRLPEWIDPSDPVESPIADLKEANKMFGRRFVIASLRWLGPGEI